VNKMNLKFRLSEVRKVFSIPGIKAICIIAVLITTWQMCALYNISGAVSSINSNPIEGALALSVMFLGMMISRFLYSLVADKFSPGRVLAVLNAICAGLWFWAMMTESISLKIILVALSAVAGGVNFPVTFGASTKIASKNTAAAAGFVSLGFYLAIFVFSPIIGRLCDQIGYSEGLATLSLPLVLIIPMGLILHKKMMSNIKKHGRETK